MRDRGLSRSGRWEDPVYRTVRPSGTTGTKVPKQTALGQYMISSRPALPVPYAQHPVLPGTRRHVGATPHQQLECHGAQLPQRLMTAQVNRLRDHAQQARPQALQHQALMAADAEAVVKLD